VPAEQSAAVVEQQEVDSNRLAASVSHLLSSQFASDNNALYPSVGADWDVVKNPLQSSLQWDTELDLRNIKTTLGMEHLRGKTPEMAIKELWVYLLACNLIRLLMAQAALLADQIPRQLSFKHSVQIWIAWQQRGGGSHDAVSINALLILIAEPRVSLRPGLIEPRARKRRPKPFPGYPER
jgi:hypothetical protein